MQRKYFHGYHYRINATWLVDKVALLTLGSEVTIVIDLEDVIIKGMQDHSSKQIFWSSLVTNDLCQQDLYHGIPCIVARVTDNG